MKKGISLLLALTLMLSFSITAVAQLSDIGTHWAKTEISYLVGKGVLNGYPDGSFKPNNPMSKVEFYKIINELLGFEEKAEVEFLDVYPTDWFYDNVAKALGSGYITSATLLNPNENITREEVARIIGAVYKIKNDSETAQIFIDNTLISEQTFGYIGTLTEKGILSGYPDGSFRPTASITRAEVVKVLYNVLNKLDELVGIVEKEEQNQVDKSKLDELIKDVEDLDKNKYTKLSWNNLEDAIDSAKRIYKDKNATQKEVNKAIEELEDEIDNLKRERNTRSNNAAERYTVKFVDWDGTILDTLRVRKGEDASKPADPTREGYNFVGWDRDFSEVTRDLVVKAVYVEDGEEPDTPLDSEKPVITLIGQATIIINVGAEFTDPGVTAVDNEDGDITTDVEVTGTVDTSKAGTYVIKYNVIDEAGNEAIEVTRTVIVEEEETQIRLESIAITEQASKLVYNVGEELDITGLEVTGTYSNGSEKLETITEDNITGFDSSEAATSQTLTITVDGKTTTYTVEIKAIPVPVTLESIAITNQASKLVYNVGEELDITGLEVTGTYSNASTKVEEITSVNVSGFDSSEAATSQTLTITVDGKTTTYTVEIKAVPIPVTLESIAITNQASKLVYNVGEELDITGLEVTGTYSNASTKVEEITSVNVSGFDSSEAATSQTLTITVDGKTTTYTVEIKAIPVPVTLESIAITNQASKLVYNVGEELDITGLEVTGTYSNASTKVEEITSVNVSGFDSSEAATSQTLTITVDGKTTTYTVEIKAVPIPVTLESIAITNQASKLVYNVGEELDITGLEVTGTYSNASTKVEEITSVNVSGFDSSEAATSQTLTITVDGKTTTYTVEIKAVPIPVTLESIAITNQASKLVYNVGEELDITGLEVTGTYSNASTKVEEITSVNVSGFDSSEAATSQTLTITVDGKTTTYTVEIKAVPIPVTLESIAITNQASKLVYNVGEELDITGLEVTGTYSNASTKVEEITSVNVSGFDSSEAATSQTLTITVDGKTTTYTVEIKAVPIPVTLESIAITNQASKLVYNVGEELDITGLEVTGTYSNASTKVEEITSVNVSGFDSSEAATSQTLTITVDGKTTTYTVEIKAIPVPVTLESIAITNQASKLVYNVGEELDITGLEVTGTYSNASTKVEEITSVNVSGFDSSEAATSQTLTITVDGKTTTYTVEIKSVLEDQLAPSGLKRVAPTTIDGSDGKITGTTSTMEYRLKGTEIWNYASDIETTALVAGTYEVRFKAYEGYNAGAILEIVVPSFVAPITLYDINDNSVGTLAPGVFAIAIDIGTIRTYFPEATSSTIFIVTATDGYICELKYEKDGEVELYHNPNVQGAKNSRSLEDGKVSIKEY